MLWKYAKPCTVFLGLAIGGLVAPAVTPQAEAGAADYPQRIEDLERFERMIQYLSPHGRGNSHYQDGEILVFHTLVPDYRAMRTRYHPSRLSDVEAEITVDFRHSMQVMAHFGSGSAMIGQKAHSVMRDVAKAISSAELRGYKFLIIGNTDSVGDGRANEFLSWERAEAFRRYLIGRLDIDPRRLIPVGVGEARPLDKQNPDAAINRRVDIVLVKDIRLDEFAPARLQRMVCLPRAFTDADPRPVRMDLDDYGGFRTPARCSFDDDEMAIDFDE